jgi:hypothetical protein
MNPEFFQNARMHTNTGEQLHYKIYIFSGIKLSTLNITDRYVTIYYY